MMDPTLANRAELRAALFAVPIEDKEIVNISGNAPEFLKKAAVRWYKLLGPPDVLTFGCSIRKRVEIKEVSLEPSVDNPQKISAKMVAELEVSQDMCNAQGFLDQGCMVAIMDEGSAIALLLTKLLEGEVERIGVSQTFNMFFYRPVPKAGAKLKIVSRSVTAEPETGCCTSEIWDAGQHRLVVTGTQIQMSPSPLRASSAKL